MEHLARKMQIAWLLLLLAPGNLRAATSYSVNASGGNQIVDEYGMCRSVTNNNSKQMFIPTSSQASWNSFITHVPPSVVVNSCTWSATTTALTTSSGSTWTVPFDWNSSNNTIECIGGGGGGANSASSAGGGGGGGGAYAKISNLTLSPNALVSFSIGTGGAAGSAGGDSWFKSTTDVLAKGGSGTTGTASGAGGSAALSVGVPTPLAGGAGGTGGSSQVRSGGGGGGGAAGKNGAGGAGGKATGAGNYGGGGGGGNGGGTAGGASSGNNGGTGGNNSGATGGGAAGTAGTNGGGGGGGSSNTAGGAGSMGTEWTSYGSGGGGGGGGSRSSAGSGGFAGGNAGNYGGGGGGAAYTSGAATGGSGAPGICLVTYTPLDIFTPTAINWADFTRVSATKTFTGINRSISVQLSAAYITGTPTLEYQLSGGTWTAFSPSSTATISVYNESTLRFRVSGTVGHSATITVTNVTAGNTVIDTVVGTAGVLTTNNINITVTQNDVITQTLTWTDGRAADAINILTLPTNGTLTVSGGTITYQANPYYTGADSFTYQLNDGGFLSNTATASITVNALTSGTYAYVENYSGSAYVLTGWKSYASSFGRLLSDVVQFSTSTFNGVPALSSRRFFNTGDGTSYWGTSYTTTFGVLPVDGTGTVMWDWPWQAETIHKKECRSDVTILVKLALNGSNQLTPILLNYKIDNSNPADIRLTGYQILVNAGGNTLTLSRFSNANEHATAYFDRWPGHAPDSANPLTYGPYKGWNWSNTFPAGGAPGGLEQIVAIRYQYNNSTGVTTISWEDRSSNGSDGSAGWDQSVTLTGADSLAPGGDFGIMATTYHTNVSTQGTDMSVVEYNMSCVVP